MTLQLHLGLLNSTLQSVSAGQFLKDFKLTLTLHRKIKGWKESGLSVQFLKSQEQVVKRMAPLLKLRSMMAELVPTMFFLYKVWPKNRDLTYCLVIQTIVLIKRIPRLHLFPKPLCQQINQPQPLKVILLRKVP